MKNINCLYYRGFPAFISRKMNIAKMSVTGWKRRKKIPTKHFMIVMQLFNEFKQINGIEEDSNESRN